MNINIALQDYVTQKGIKQIYIAQKSGISQDAISKMLKGRRRILADDFIRICSALEIDPNIFKDPPMPQ